MGSKPNVSLIHPKADRLAIQRGVAHSDGISTGIEFNDQRCASC